MAVKYICDNPDCTNPDKERPGKMVCAGGPELAAPPDEWLVITTTEGAQTHYCEICRTEVQP